MLYYLRTCDVLGASKAEVWLLANKLVQGQESRKPLYDIFDFYCWRGQS
jgi:hypothetical protein